MYGDGGSFAMVEWDLRWSGSRTGGAGEYASGGFWPFSVWEDRLSCGVDAGLGMRMCMYIVIQVRVKSYLFLDEMMAFWTGRGGCDDGVFLQREREREGGGMKAAMNGYRRRRMK